MIRRILMAVALSSPYVHAQSMQSTLDAVHPSPKEVANALNSIDLNFGKYVTDVQQLSSRSGNAAGFLEMTGQTKDVARKWSATTTVSEGRELPNASDLFFILLQLQDSSAFIDALTREPKGWSREQLNAGTDAIHAQTDLLQAEITLRYAVAARIEAEEAACSKNVVAPARKKR